MQRLAFFLLLAARLCQSQTGKHKYTTWEEVPLSTEQTGILWGGCPEGYRVSARCMRLEVPLDYEDLEAGNTTLAFMKKNVANGGNKTPEMIVTLGGPGRSGLEDFLSERIPSRHVLGEKHNIIAFDPRGVGRSGPNLDCFGGDLAASYQLASGEYPFTSSSLKTTYEKAGVWGDLCKKNLNVSARYIGTPAVARDLLTYFERQARTHGVSSDVNFYGAGYGAVLGATFATMYPHRVGRIVLDSPMGGEAYYSDVQRYALADQDDAVLQFFSQCSEAGPDVCKFWGATPEDIEARYKRLLRKLEDHPLQIPFDGAPVDAPIQLTVDSVRAQMLAATYRGHNTFRRLAELLADLERGEYRSWDMKYLKAPSCAKCTLDDWEFLHETFQNPVSKYWNQWAAYAISCSDLAPSGNLTLKEFQLLMAGSLQSSSYAGIESAGMAYCSRWPLSPPLSQQFDGFFGGETTHPMLIIANTFDPISPIAYAREMADQFPGSTLMEQKIVAHGAASWGDCINGHVQNYFEKGRPRPYGSRPVKVCKPGISYSTTGEPSLPAREWMRT